MDFRRWLEWKRQQIGMSGRQFAKLLNIKPQHWSEVVRGEKGISLRMAKGAWRNFPEDRDLICSLALGDEDWEPAA